MTPRRRDNNVCVIYHEKILKLYVNWQAEIEKEAIRFFGGGILNCDSKDGEQQSQEVV